MPKIVDHDQKREELLQKSFALFARRGYGSVTMRELAQEIGTSTGTLYHYFKDKEHLFQQMFEVLSRQDVARALKEIPSVAGPEEKLRGMFEFLQAGESYFQDVLFLAIDYFRYHSGGEGREALRKVAQHYQRAMKEQLGLDDTGLERLLFSFFLGLLVQRLLDPEEGDYEGHEKFLEMIGKSTLQDLF